MNETEKPCGTYSPAISPDRIFIAPLFGRPNSLHLEFVQSCLFELPSELEKMLPGCSVELLSVRGSADVPGSRSALCRQLVMDMRSRDFALLLDDDVIPYPEQVVAMMDWAEARATDSELLSLDLPAVGLDYLQRGWTTTRPGTVLDVDQTAMGIRPGSVLMGAGCLLVAGKTMLRAVQMSNGFPSTSYAERGSDGRVIWMSDDYSLCRSLGGVYALPGQMARHLAAVGAPLSSRAQCVAQLEITGMGKPRVPRPQ